MTQWTSLSTRQSTKDRFGTLKEQAEDNDPSVPEYSNDEFLQVLMDAYEREQVGDPADPIDATVDLEPIHDRLDEIAEAASMGADPAVDGEQVAEDIAEQLDEISDLLEMVEAAAHEAQQAKEQAHEAAELTNRNTRMLEELTRQ